MQLKLQFDFLFVGKDEEGFVKNYFYELDDEKYGEKASLAGKLFVNLEMTNNLALGEEVGELIFHSLKTEFFREFEEDPYVRFEEALKMTNKRIVAMQDDKQFQFVSNLNVISAAIVGDELFLSQTGDAEAYLVRRKHVSVVSEGLSEGDKNKNDVFLNIASGTLEKGDFVVFSSTRLLRYMSKSELGAVFGERDLVLALDSLKELLRNEISNKTGVLGIRIEGVNMPEISVKKSLSLPNFRIPKVAGLHKVFGVASAVFSMMKRGKAVLGSLRRFGRERILVVVVVAVIILVAGAFNVRKGRTERVLLEGLDVKLSEAQTFINNAETRGAYDKKTAGILLNNAEAKILEVLDTEYYREKAAALLELLTKQRDSLDNVIRVSDIRVVADLSQMRSGIKSKGFMRARDGIYVYDDTSVFRIVLNKVEAPKILDENETIVSGAYFEDRDSLVFLTNSNRVLEYQDGRVAFMDNDDGSFHGGVSILTYSNKIYILDPKNSQLWRYQRRRDDYSGAEKYNGDGDLSKAVNFSIDGSIYVVNEGGSLLKFYTGEQQSLVVSKEPLSPLSAPTKIFTEYELNQVYILEPKLNRILFLNKDLKSGDLVYSGQYVFDGVDGIVDFFVDKVSNTLYLLDNAKVYETPL